MFQFPTDAASVSLETIPTTVNTTAGPNPITILKSNFVRKRRAKDFIKLKSGDINYARDFYGSNLNCMISTGKNGIHITSKQKAHNSMLILFGTFKVKISPQCNPKQGTFPEILLRSCSSGLIRNNVDPYQYLCTLLCKDMDLSW